MADSNNNNITEIHITRAEILMGRDAEFPLTPQMEENLSELLVALNKFRNVYGKPMRVSSGYRPGKYNEAAHGAPNSNHLVCMACDFFDATGELDQYCLDNLDLLAQCGLWLESPDFSPGWTHLQTKPPDSGKRVFIP